jgi:nucleotide-binding universal stress UspA family protein
MFASLLVPLDGSAHAERALPIAARIARASASHILLVRAVAVPAIYDGVMYNGEALRGQLLHDETERARDYLGEIARSSPLAGLPVESIAELGSPADVILDVAAARRAELIVMMSHGRTGLGRWVLGSVSEHVVHHASAPVLVLRGGTVGAVDLAPSA